MAYLSLKKTQTIVVAKFAKQCNGVYLYFILETCKTAKGIMLFDDEYQRKN